MFIDQPPRQVLQKHKMSGHLARWIIELSEFNIQYKPHSIIKSQVLTDFDMECTILDEEVSTSQQAAIEDEPIPLNRS